VTALSLAAYAGMFVFGIVMALLGAIIPSLSGTLNFTLAQAGNLFLVMNGGMLITSLVLGVLMDRFGMKPPMTIAPWLVGLALVLIARAGAYADLLPAAVLAGVGGGALNGATNTLIADLHQDERKKSSALNVLGVFFGIGALSLPLTIGALLAVLGLRGLLYAAAAVCAGAGLYSMLLQFPKPKQAHRLPIGEIPRFLGVPAVIAMAFLLFFQSGNEFILGGYFSSFLTRDFRMTVEGASYVLAGYWGALILARLVLARVLNKWHGTAVILGSALVAAAGCVIAGTAASVVAAGVGIVVTGAAIAGIFPTLLGLAGARFREHSGTVFGILLTAALTGGMTMPWLAGRAAASAGLRYAFVLAAVNFSVIALIDLRLRAERTRATAQHASRPEPARAKDAGSGTGVPTKP
jgi:fucose permease